MRRRDNLRGTVGAIDPALWAELQQMERAGKTLLQIREWLQNEHGVVVDKATVGRTLAKVRAAIPLPPIDLGLTPEPEPATDEDELTQLRKRFREETRNERSAKDRQGAARLLLSIMAVQRELKKPQGATPGTDSPSSAWSPPTFGVKETN